MRLRVSDKFVVRLVDDMGALLTAENAALRGSVFDRLCDLAERQSEAVARYWKSTARGFGVPTSACRGAPLFHFPESEPLRVFKTSGTSGRTRGVAAYSAAGASLLNHAIVGHARSKLAAGSSGPRFACIRLLPASAAAPDVVMAYGMECIADELGFRSLSDTAFSGLQLDFSRLVDLLDRAVAEHAPVLLMGGTFAFVTCCDSLLASRRTFALPEGSVVLDAGGLKNRARRVTTSEYEKLVYDCFGPVRCVNLFGMTELASQLYDAAPEPVGPNGERAKGGCAWAWPTVRDPDTLAPTSDGIGLLEVADLAILDRPCVILSDDIARATPHGAAPIGRAMGAPTRGCALHVEELAGGPA